MEKSEKGNNSIDEYIAGFPEEIQKKLTELRKAIKEVTPDAQEKISYQMPTFAQNGNLVHFAAFKNHIGFYPAPSGVEKYQEDLVKYKTSKGAIQFPINQEIPLELVREIVKFRLKENLAKAKQKKLGLQEV